MKTRGNALRWPEQRWGAKMTNIVERLRERAAVARSESNGTALGDAVHFEEAAARIERLEAVLARLLSYLADEKLRKSGLVEVERARAALGGSDD